MSKSTAKSTTKNNKAVEKSRGFSPFNFVLNLTVKPAFAIIGYILLSVFLGIVIEWAGMAMDYFPVNHAELVLRQEFAYLGDNFSTTLFGVSARDAALIVIRSLNGWIGGMPSSHSAMLSAQSYNSLSGAMTPYLNAAIYIMMITGVRCVIILLSVALFLIVGVAAAIDGLHVRELRKVGGDDEHGDVYHWAKASIPKIVILSPIIYLAWPTAINPNFILLPGMTLFFIAIFQLFAKYKKVL